MAGDDSVERWGPARGRPRDDRYGCLDRAATDPAGPAPARPGHRPGHREGRRVPRRPARRPRIPTWSTAPDAAEAALGDARLHPRPPLPARRGHRVRRRHRRLVQARPAGRRAPRGGVHRLLRRALHGRERRHPDQPTTSRSILPDLAAGCSMADMAEIGQVEDAWERFVDAGLADVDRPDHVHELHGRDQGVHRAPRRHGLHVVQRQASPWSGPSSRASGCFFLPDQHLGRNTAVLDLGLTPRRLRGLRPAQARRRAHRRAAARREGGPVARALLGARPVHRGRASTRSASGSPASTSWCTPSAGTRWSRRPTTSARPSTSSSDHRRRRAGIGVGDRHRAEPRPPAGQRPPRQAGHLPRPHGLLLLDDEPHRPAAPGVGAGEPGRGQRRQPDRGRRRHRALGPRRARPDARPARCPRRPRTDRPSPQPSRRARTSRRQEDPTLARGSAVGGATGRGRPRSGTSAPGPSRPRARRGAGRGSAAPGRCRASGRPWGRRGRTSPA